MASHEPLQAHRKVKLSSDRKFGIVFSIVFAIFGIWPFVFHHQPIRWWLLALAAVFLILAAIAPQSLNILNKAWFKLGQLLNLITGPIIMGLMFFAGVVPVGWILRKQGKDLLGLKHDPEAETYWIKREPPGPASGTLTKQF
ncbi:MAG TPA: SxtJ family membrane protein [Beijerinckia sp.]|jgi:hypothetical protein|nr:SxtJ family membrane protein [Beijerinckia sp.]